MSNISEILKSTAHRPYEYPERPWWYYQEWNRALLLHYLLLHYVGTIRATQKIGT